MHVLRIDAARSERRPMRDVDLAAHNLSNEPEAIARVVETILAVAREDGWEFGATSAEAIREQDAYSGVRVFVPCTLASARFAFNVDVNVGDEISPPPVEVSIPRLLGGAIHTRGYALSMVVAEKVVTALQRTTIRKGSATGCRPTSARCWRRSPPSRTPSSIDA